MLREIDEKKARAEARLSAVKEAILVHCTYDDLRRLHDVVVDAIGHPGQMTFEQVECVFRLLPDRVIGLGVSWGFRDTEFADEAYHFALDNRDEILAVLNLQERQGDV